MIVRGCTPKDLDIPYESNISFRGIEVVDGELKKFRVIDPYVKRLIQNGIVQTNVPYSQNSAVAYLDTSEFVVFAESLAAAIDFDNLTNDVIENMGELKLSNVRWCLLVIEVNWLGGLTNNYRFCSSQIHQWVCCMILTHTVV